ncbi:Ribonuclease HII [Pyrodictium delaneyi]|uniref:Ribonuclease HII n=2 Tax=Pyrodictium delaneyi TaxID=1273541 RepID=A0A0P0N4I2_9CREN|nr:ribonuclease HII [Pyrodictium delaneyi]ALL01619.1 Ribonuclease HII [Pyrodictium delaneyi]
MSVMRDTSIRRDIVAYSRDDVVLPRSKGKLLGIDEAGRGPIIGPMVVAGVLVDSSTVPILEKLGVRDSKELTPAQRRELFARILDLASYVVIVKIPPAVIDTVNLNRLEISTIAHIVRRTSTIYRDLDAVYIDAVGPASKMASEVRRLSGFQGTIVAKPKADRRYLPVSAASIVAKVVRDEEIEKLRQLYGIRGSGYPTDPHTLEWIREAYRESPHSPPWFVRRSWSTLKRVAPGWYRAKSTEASNKSGKSRQKSLLDYLAGRSRDS